MKKLFNNLPFRLLLGIIIGVILGQVFPESVMKVVVTLQYIKAKARINAVCNKITDEETKRKVQEYLEGMKENEQEL